jgi:hypothetical protein
MLSGHRVISVEVDAQRKGRYELRQPNPCAIDLDDHP